MGGGTRFMRKTKVISVLLAVAMLTGLFTGCSGKASVIDTDRFVKACDKMGLSDYEFGGDDSPDEGDLEDGFYIYADEDAVEDDGVFIDLYLATFGLQDVFDSSNVESFAIASKFTGLEDLEDLEDPDDLESIKLDGAFAFQMTLDDDYSEDIMEGLEDLLEDNDISIKKLSDKEFSVTKNGGYLRLHADAAKVLKDFFDDDMRSAVKKLTGDIALSVEVSGNNILVLAGGALNAKSSSELKKFAKAFGAVNPAGVSTNDKAFSALLEFINPGMSSFTRGMGSKKVGISMPTKDLQRWNQDGDMIKKTLEAAGYEADLQYANNKVDVQISQIEDMINTGCKVLIIAAIEGNSLGTVLEKANKSGVTVIAYDRPIMDSDCVDYYTSFDNYLVGQIQGEYVRNALSLDSTSGPYYIEFTAGDPGDNNAIFFYNGAMDVLRPYIDSGKLIVASGQTDFDSVATPEWSTATAQARAENIIYSCYMYPTVNIDAWLCSNDSTAWGVVNALDSTYTGSWPVITGMDCDIVNVKYIIGGKQAMSVFKDTRTLAMQAAKMAGQILEGDNVAVNSSSYNNSVDIPTFLCEPVFADINNYKAILIDSGYYTEAELT